jgi:hypothetical protein
MHLNPPRLPPQQPNILPKSLRLPKRHMRLPARPPNRNHSRLALDPLMLHNLMRDTVRSRAGSISRRSRLFFEPFRSLGTVGQPVGDWFAIAVKRCDFGYRGAESFGESIATAGGLEVDVVDLRVAGHDGAEALDEGLVGGRGHEGLVVLAGGPV